LGFGLGEQRDAVRLMLAATLGFVLGDLSSGTPSQLARWVPFGPRCDVAFPIAERLPVRWAICAAIWLQFKPLRCANEGVVPNLRSRSLPGDCNPDCAARFFGILRGLFEWFVLLELVDTSEVGNFGDAKTGVCTVLLGRSISFGGASTDAED
jgi:hypothetical protein